MTPIEFVLWLNGAAELVGDQPPTPEQWAVMREKLGEAVGGIVANRLLERAEQAHREEVERAEKQQRLHMAATQAMNLRLSAMPPAPLDVSSGTVLLVEPAAYSRNTGVSGIFDRFLGRSKGTV